LPDICGKVDNPSYGSQKRYAEWCNAYLNEKYWNGLVTISSSDIYALRCAMLHEGNIDVSGQSAHKLVEIFALSVNKNIVLHRCQVGEKYALHILSFCNDICEAVENWLENNPVDLPLSFGLEQFEPFIKITNQ